MELQRYLLHGTVIGDLDTSQGFQLHRSICGRSRRESESKLAQRVDRRPQASVPLDERQYLAGLLAVQLHLQVQRQFV